MSRDNRHKRLAPRCAASPAMPRLTMIQHELERYIVDNDLEQNKAGFDTAIQKLGYQNELEAIMSQQNESRKPK